MVHPDPAIDEAAQRIQFVRARRGRLIGSANKPSSHAARELVPAIAAVEKCQPCPWPDGTPRKLLDVSRLAKLGWRASTSLEEGIRLAYQAFLSETK